MSRIEDCYEPCIPCRGSGLAMGIYDVTYCTDCKGDGMVRRRDDRGRFVTVDSGEAANDQ